MYSILFKPRTIKEVLRNFLKCKEVTKADLVSLVDKVEINEQKKITIHYKYNLLNKSSDI